MAPTEDVIGVLTYAAIEDRHFGTSSPIGNASSCHWNGWQPRSQRRDLCASAARPKRFDGLPPYSGDGCDRPFRVFAVHIIYLLNGAAVRRSQKGGRDTSGTQFRSYRRKPSPVFTSELRRTTQAKWSATFSSSAARLLRQTVRCGVWNPAQKVARFAD